MGVWVGIHPLGFIGAVTLLAAGIVSFSIKEKKDSVRYVQVPREVILSSDETTVATT